MVKGNTTHQNVDALYGGGRHLPNGRTWMNNLDVESLESDLIKIIGTIAFIDKKVSGFLFCTMQN